MGRAGADLSVGGQGLCLDLSECLQQRIEIVVRLQSRTDGTFAGEAEPLADIRTLAEYAEHRQKLSE
jgi:hypothetical protein